MSIYRLFLQGTTSGYEQTRQLVEFHGMFGQGIMGIRKQEALSLLTKSDFLILTTLQRSGIYPFYQYVSQYWNDLKAWADKNMIVVRTVPFDTATATIYVAPSAMVSGLSGGWITSAGLLIETERVGLQRFPKIRLSGQANYSWLPKMPAVSTVIDTNESSQAVSGVVPAHRQRLRNPNRHIFNATAAIRHRSTPPQIRYVFLPKEIGINGDTRELVVQAPTLVEVIRPDSR